MKKSLISLLSFIIVAFMLMSILVSCAGELQNSSDCSSTEESNQESGSEGESGSSGGDDNNSSDTPVNSLEGPFASSIVNSQALANGVQSYYTSADRNNYKIENLNMNLEYSLTDTKKLSAITNKNGNAYIQDTMDVYVLMEDGTRVFASSTKNDIRTNIYRIGSYYYDVHFLENNFLGEFKENKSVDLDASLFTGRSAGIGGFKCNSKGEIRFAVSGGDPYFYMGGGENQFTFSAEEYNAIQFSVKTTNADQIQIYYLSGDKTGHTDDQSVKIDIENDDEYHTYTVLLTSGAGFEGDIGKIRIDFNGATIGETINIREFKLVNVSVTGVEGLYFDRTMHTYSDKLHQELHFIATQQITGIKELGIVTEIAVDTVDKLIVKDANNTYTSLDGVDWNTAQYIGFDVKGAGIFGYIIPTHKDAGKMTVEIVDGKYVITQTFCPENGTIEPINAKVTYTDNDFYSGNRIYTDDTHSFDSFIREAEFEINPLKGISSDGFIGYEAFKGAYSFSVSGTGFNPPFFLRLELSLFCFRKDKKRS